MTLARRIRRIGLLPSTYTTTITHQLVKNEQGAMEDVTYPHSIRQVNREDLSLDELHQRVKDVRAAYRIRNLAFRADRRKARVKK